MPPRASTGKRNATPGRATRASTALAQETPNTAARRSTRALSRAPVTAREAVANPALPDVQTQQSYAYGSSRAPALPEQLHARDTMSLRAVANRLTVAADEAQRNFEAQAAEIRGSTPESQIVAREVRAQRRASREVSEVPSEVPKDTRTAAWVNSSQLDDIEEESRGLSIGPDDDPETPRLRDTSLASSFPSGSFNHSYAYEMGTRKPRLPTSAQVRRNVNGPGPGPGPGPELESEQTPVPRRQRESVIRNNTTTTQAQRQHQGLPLHKKAISHVRSSYNATTRLLSRVTRSSLQTLLNVVKSVWSWFHRMVQALQKSILDLPDTPGLLSLFQVLAITSIATFIGFCFCSIFTYTCDATSPSIITHHLQSICGRCTGTPSFDFSNTNTSDVQSLLSALQYTQSQINLVEQRVNSKLASSSASHSAEAATLRNQYDAIELQIRRLTQNPPSHGSGNVPSPLIPKINFFSPSNGAVVIPYLTSPTRAATNLGARLLYRMARVRKTLSAPPIIALEPWLDEGDCWCAASTQPKSTDQDSVRLAVQTSQRIFPTELVIEHFPPSGSLEPGVAPREIELWADFSDVSAEDYSRLHISDLVSESPAFSVKGTGRSWARIGSALYTVDADGATPHVQRFNLLVNQNGLLHWSDRFLVRVKTNYGADWTCLYRVRLHGMPVED